MNMLTSLNHQHNTAYELTALSTQWKELCHKNIEIQAACTEIENHLEELRKEASERLLVFYWIGSLLVFSYLEAGTWKAIYRNRMVLFCIRNDKVFFLC